MRGVWQSIVFLLVIVFISLLYKLPAKFVYQQLATNSPVQLVGISGSIWSGSASQIHTQNFIIENLKWQLSPLNLLRGEVAISWVLEDRAVMLNGDMLLSSDQIIIKNTQGQVDVLPFMQRLPSQQVLLGGIIKLNINELNLTQGKLLDTVGIVEWKQAELLSPENIVLGGFKADLSDDAGRLRIQFTDTDEALFAEGKIIVSTQGEFQYSMQLAVRDTSATGLIEGFNQLGQPDNEGKITLRGSGDVFNYN